jgi:hypothetical protein
MPNVEKFSFTQVCGVRFESFDFYKSFSTRHLAEFYLNCSGDAFEGIFSPSFEVPGEFLVMKEQL